MPINCFEFRICRAAEPCNCRQTGAKNTTLYTADWLRRCAGRNPSALGALRGLANTTGNSFSDNESLFRSIADRIASGQLRVCQLQAAAGGGGGSGAAAEPAYTKPFPFEPKPKAASAGSSRPADNDPDTLSNDSAPAAQAAALNAAAKDGAPFCPE